MSWRDVHFLPEEVFAHDKPDDCWIIIFGVVKNITKLIEEHRDTDLVYPLLKEAGNDVSYWFEVDCRKKLTLKMHLHPETGAKVSALPFRLPHEPNSEPDVSWVPNGNTKPWWMDEKYNVGVETLRPIKVCIMNPLIKRSVTITVCVEDTVSRVLDRYSPYNPEINRYSIRYLGKTLRNDLSLSENGVLMKSDDSREDYVPTLVLRYRDRIPAIHPVEL